ncbi:MAG TPA: glycosyltransferase [Solirubrobacterales bacterium]
MPTLSLIVPAFDEEARLPALLDVLEGSAEEAVARAGFELAETLVVDDGSGDRTAEILAAAGGPKLRPILGGAHEGKGAAVARGVRAAGGEYVLLADADLSTPLGELGQLSAAIREGADVAVGSRAVAGAAVDRGPVHRKLTGRAFGVAVRLLTGLPIRDTQNGFKLLRTATARELFSEQLCPGFAFDVELLMRAQRAGLRIAEVPVLYVHDSRSRLRVGRASFEMLAEVSRLALRLQGRGFRPRRP